MYKICSKCNIEKDILNFKKDNSKKDGRYSSCKECVKKYRANHYLNNIEEYREKNKQYYIDNKEHICNKVSEYTKNRKKNDDLFRLKMKLRTKTYQAFKKNSWTKNSSNLDMLGCDFKTAKIHLESLFLDGMNWENHGEWHIDHIIPLSSAKNSNDLQKLFNYKNLQPLWAKDNWAKGKKIINN